MLRRRFLNQGSEPPIPNNEIWYKTDDGLPITVSSGVNFGANIIDHTYKNGKGIITFDSDVTNIGQEAFARKPNITSLTIPNTVTKIEYGAFINLSFKSFIIPDSVTSIGNSVFYNCNNLESISISKNVNSIGTSVFVYCISLKEIHFPTSYVALANAKKRLIFDEFFLFSLGINTAVQKQKETGLR